MAGVSDKKRDLVLGASLLFAVFLWGANNTGTKFIVGHWPAVWTGSSRFLCAGLVLLAFLKLTARRTGADRDARDGGGVSRRRSGWSGDQSRRDAGAPGEAGPDPPPRAQTLNS